MGTIAGVVLTPLKVIEGPAGKVMHALKAQEEVFQGFGEAYFSTVATLQAKGWKKHLRMLLNLVVPAGSIRFVLFDDRDTSPTRGQLMEVELGPANYQRLTVPPGIWMAFQGRATGTNMLLNIASIPHDPTEAENLPLNNTLIPFEGFDQ